VIWLSCAKLPHKCPATAHSHPPACWAPGACCYRTRPPILPGILAIKYSFAIIRFPTWLHTCSRSSTLPALPDSLIDPAITRHPAVVMRPLLLLLLRNTCCATVASAQVLVDVTSLLQGLQRLLLCCTAVRTGEPNLSGAGLCPATAGEQGLTRRLKLCA
jgi:hypothetical protein